MCSVIDCLLPIQAQIKIEQPGLLRFPGQVTVRRSRHYKTPNRANTQTETAVHGNGKSTHAWTKWTNRIVEPAGLVVLGHR